MMKIAMTMLTAWLLVSGCTTTVEGSLGPQKGSLDKRVEAHLALARGYLEQRDYERARGPLESALELDPQSSEAHVLLAILYQAQGEENKLVQRQYELALRYDPTNAQALNNYGTYLYSLGRLDDARDKLEQAAADVDYGRRPQAYENLGLVLMELDEMDAAELAFQRSLRLNSGGARANMELADIYFNAGDYPTAARYYAAFGALAQQDARSLWLGVRLARAFDDQNAAASYALALRNLYPGSDEYQQYRDSLK